MRRDQNPWIARYFGGPRGRAAEVRNEPDAEHRG
jgi:hypothetical protein